MMKLIKKISNALNCHQIFNVPVLVWLLRIETLLCLTIVVRWLYGDLILSNNLKISLPFITVSMENKSPLVMTIPLLMSLALWIRGKVSYYFVLGYFYYQIGMYLLAVITIIIESIIPPAAVLFSYLPIETDGLIAALFNSLMVKCWTHEINRRFYMEEAEETSPSKRISIKGVITMFLIAIFPMFLFNRLSTKIAYVGEQPEKITNELIAPVFWKTTDSMPIPIDVHTDSNGNNNVLVLDSGNHKNENSSLPLGNVCIYDFNTQKENFSCNIDKVKMGVFAPDENSLLIAKRVDSKNVNGFNEISIKNNSSLKKIFDRGNLPRTTDYKSNKIIFSPNAKYFLVVYSDDISTLGSSNNVEVWDYEKRKLLFLHSFADYLKKETVYIVLGWINDQEYLIWEIGREGRGIVGYRINGNTVVTVQKEFANKLLEKNKENLLDREMRVIHNKNNDNNILYFNEKGLDGRLYSNIYVLDAEMDCVKQTYAREGNVSDILVVGFSKLLLCESMWLATGNMLFTFLDTNTGEKTSFRTDDSVKKAYTWSNFKWIPNNKLIFTKSSFTSGGYIIDFNKVGYK